MVGHANEKELSQLWNSLRDYCVNTPPRLLLGHICSILKASAKTRRKDDIFIDLLCQQAVSHLNLRVGGVVRNVEVVNVVHLINAYSGTAQLGFFKHQFQVLF